MVALLSMKICVGRLSNHLHFDAGQKLTNMLGFKDFGYDFVNPFVLYFSYGLLDAMFQSLV